MVSPKGLRREPDTTLSLAHLAILDAYMLSDVCQGECPVENQTPLISISESLLGMNEIECARCGWNWFMFEGQTEADCPFCPREWGGVSFDSGISLME